jgi:hypothetical protein
MIPEHAEFVALRISQHHPGHLTLANVDTRSAECDESFDLGVLSLGAKVEMKAVLGMFLVGDRLEHESRKPVGLWPGSRTRRDRRSR